MSLSDDVANFIEKGIHRDMTEKEVEEWESLFVAWVSSLESLSSRHYQVRDKWLDSQLPHNERVEAWRSICADRGRMRKMRI